MFATVLLSLLVPAPAPAITLAPQDPPVRIELNNDRQFVRGEHGKVKIRTDDDGFLVVLHADPDGRVRVLFPLDPDDDNYVRGRHTYELRDRGDRETFTVDAGSGQGAIYAAVSRDPFRFDAFAVNQHWDYDALNAQDPGSDPEPVLDDIVQRMASSRYDYDYVTYDVYESEYSSVSYATPAVVYTPSYYYSSYYCDSFYDYYCDPYYYSPYRFSVSLHYGSPYYYRPYYYPYYYGYDGYYYRPSRYYGYPAYSYPYYNTPGVIGYRQRYTTPSDFKQSDRLWNGVPYRDRAAGTPARAVNTVYDPAPVRRGTTSGDMGRSPAQNAEAPGNAEPRRRSTVDGQRSTTVDGQRSTADSKEPRVGRRAPSAPSRPSTVERRPASVERSGSGEPRRAEPSTGDRSRSAVDRRPSTRQGQGEPQLQRRSETRSAPTIERAEPPSRRAGHPVEIRGEPSVGRPAERVESPSRREAELPRRVERPAPVVRSAPRSEPSMRSAPPPRSSAAPSRASEPRSAPARTSGGGGGGGGGRRGPR
ncbi:MAG TPA: DUF4384 domain-containing protein [Gemmatimonadales bacterium]|jgi:hypothetical protein|nr:DUF4384 domain-containing protein [Gemmatimonadales bacterium]